MPGCSRCHDPLDTNGRYCRTCRAWYMRRWRARQKRERAQLIRDLVARARAG